METQSAKYEKDENVAALVEEDMRTQPMHPHSYQKEQELCRNKQHADVYPCAHKLGGDFLLKKGQQSKVFQ